MNVNGMLSTYANRMKASTHIVAGSTLNASFKVNVQITTGLAFPHVVIWTAQLHF